MESVETSQTQVYECNDYKFSVYNGDRRADEITLYLPEREITLEQVRAASGVKYQNNNVLFWNKGDRALLEIEGNTYNCRRNPLREPRDNRGKRPVDFRATGNEPGWLLEITNHSIRMLTNYANERVVTPVPPPQLTEEAKIYEAETEAHEIRIVIHQQSCTDTMSDEEFESEVTVYLDEETFTGCGERLS